MIVKGEKSKPGATSRQQSVRATEGASLSALDRDPQGPTATPRAPVCWCRNATHSSSLAGFPQEPARVPLGSSARAVGASCRFGTHRARSREGGGRGGRRGGLPANRKPFPSSFPLQSLCVGRHGAAFGAGSFGSERENTAPSRRRAGRALPRESEFVRAEGVRRRQRGGFPWLPMAPAQAVLQLQAPETAGASEAGSPLPAGRTEPHPAKARRHTPTFHWFIVKIPSLVPSTAPSSSCFPAAKKS